MANSHRLFSSGRLRLAYRKFGGVSLRSTAALLAALAAMPLALSSASAEPEAAKTIHQLSGRVVTPNGAPAQGADIFYDLVDTKAHKVIIDQHVTADQDGKFTVSLDTPPSLTPITATHLAVISAVMDKSGVSVGLPAGQDGVIKLVPVTQFRIRLLDTQGKPVAHTKIAPTEFILGSMGAEWEAVASDRWTAETDEHGWATITGLPQGARMDFATIDDRFARPETTVQLAGKSTTPDQVCHLEPSYTIQGTVSYGTTHDPASGITVVANLTGDQFGTGMAGDITEPDGHFKIDRMRAGSYVVTTFQPIRNSEWLSCPMPVVIGAGKISEPVSIDLAHGSIITGTVTDKKSGAPLKDFNVSVLGKGPTGGASGLTDENGKYQIRVLPGKQVVTAYSEGTYDSPPPREIDITDGATVTEDFRVPAPIRPRAVHGVVLTLDGKPAPNARVIAVDMFGPNDPVMSDEAGRFVFNSPGLSPKGSVLAQSGRLATKGFILPNAEGDVTLRLAPNVVQPITGIVRDGGNKPLKGAFVELTISHDGYRQSVEKTESDGAGRFEFASGIAGQEYYVSANKAGYTNVYSASISISPGRSKAVQAITLRKADQTVGGKVMDSHGNPIEGADVQCTDVAGVRAKTDASGHFRLTGVPQGSCALYAQSSNGGYKAEYAMSGTDNTVLVIRSEAERNLAQQHFQALFDADQSKHGNGDDAHKLLAASEKRAATERKKVFLVFHASWCGPCFVLNRFLNDPAVKPIMDAHFVVQELDIWEHNKNGWENPGGTDILKQYHGPNSVPSFYILEPSGKKLSDSMRGGQNMGVPSSAAEIALFLRNVKAAAPSLTARQIGVLEAGLKKAGTF